MDLINLVAIYSLIFDINSAIVKSVIKVESNWHKEYIGQAGELGLMQVMPMYSKYSKEQLVTSEINIKEGIRLLKEAKENCIHQEDLQWLTCYNRGVAGGNRVKYPKIDSYYLKVMKEYRRISENQDFTVQDGF